MSTDPILLDVRNGIATITNNRPEKHNAANDEMDSALWNAIAEIRANKDVRCVIWNAKGKSWSSGRDTSQLGIRTEDIDNLSFIERGQAGCMTLFDLHVPVICAHKGWVIGGSFERSLVADIRICTPETRYMLPEVKHGVLTDTGGMARLFQMVGHGVTMDLVLTGRVMDAQEALQHGIVSRIVEADSLEETAREMAEGIASAPAFTVKMARRNMHLIADAVVRESIREEATTQTLVFASEDYAEMKAAREAKREAKYRAR